jgi:nucleoside diphosphate kinase
MKSSRGNTRPSTLAAPRQFDAGGHGDTDFNEAFEDLKLYLPSTWEEFLFSTSAIVLKPDAVVRRKLGGAITFLLEAGFHPVAVMPFTFNRNMVREMWRHNTHLVATRKWRILVDLFLPSSPSLYVMLSSDGNASLTAAEQLSRFKGSARMEDRQRWQLRAQLEAEYPLLNFVHTPDDHVNFVRELGILFASSMRKLLIVQAASRKDISKLLSETIAEMYRVQPEHDFSFPRSLQRIARSCQEQTSNGSDADGVVEECRLLAEGRQKDWEPLFESLLLSGFDTALWDRAIVGATLTTIEDGWTPLCPEHD